MRRILLFYEFEKIKQNQKISRDCFKKSFEKKLLPAKYTNYANKEKQKIKLYNCFSFVSCSSQAKSSLYFVKLSVPEQLLKKFDILIFGKTRRLPSFRPRFYFPIRRNRDARLFRKSPEIGERHGQSHREKVSAPVPKP